MARRVNFKANAGCANRPWCAPCYSSALSVSFSNIKIHFPFLEIKHLGRLKRGSGLEITHSHCRFLNTIHKLLRLNNMIKGLRPAGLHDSQTNTSAARLDKQTSRQTVGVPLPTLVREKRGIKGCASASVGPTLSSGSEAATDKLGGWGGTNGRQ